jgi:hypothetical protein
LIHRARLLRLLRLRRLRRLQRQRRLLMMMLTTALFLRYENVEMVGGPRGAAVVSLAASIRYSTTA